MTKRVHRTAAGGLRHTIGDAAQRAAAPAQAAPHTRRSAPIRRADSDSADDKPKDDTGGTDDKKIDDDDDGKKDTERASSGPLYDGSEDS